MTTNSELKISFSTIRSVQAEFDKSISGVFKVSAATLVEDSSTSRLDKVNQAIVTSTIGLAETVQVYNTYLNDLATMFEAKDSELAKSIERITIKEIESPTLQANKRKSDAKNTQSYKGLKD